MAKNETNGNDETQSIIRIAEKIDNELKELPIETQGAVINVLSQCCEHRIAMINRARRKEADDEKRAAQYGLSRKPQ